MVADPIYYQLFKMSPETFFLLLGMSHDAARQLADRYQFQAVEFKKTSRRADGVFLPRELEDKVYFLEIQFYPLSMVFANLIVKVFSYPWNRTPLFQ